MKERPILFSAPMVRAILEGRKTQTRRVAKYRVVPRSDSGMLDFWRVALNRAARWMGSLLNGEGNALKLCPYGAVGDRLWVRETWGLLFDKDPDEQPTFWRADYTAEIERSSMLPSRWRPSIHMPRARSRINLEVTGVRVERLQEISEADALAEGVEGLGQMFDARTAYAALWNSINGAESWLANPWVWVVEFKRVTP